MPSLADIYSTIDSYKRKLGDVVGNPIGSLQQAYGNANDQAGQLNDLTYQAALEGTKYGPATQQLGQQIGSAYNPAGTVNKYLVSKYPNVALDISEMPNAIDLSRIVVPKENRGQGIGSSVMQDLIDYADQTGKQVRLSPSSDFGGSPTRLKKFYKEFGFVENKGRNKDFSTRETMIRPSAEEVPIYHGTTPENAKTIEKSGFDVGKSADGSIWFTSNPNIGEVAASGKGGIIQKTLNHKKMKLGGWDETDKYSTDELINMGYDGLKLPSNGQTTYQIFSPEKLK
jgi:GNAT superfamily N-acetyltransferase